MNLKQTEKLQNELMDAGMHLAALLGVNVNARETQDKISQWGRVQAPIISRRI